MQWQKYLLRLYALTESRPFQIGVWISIFLLFWTVAFVSLDPDFGWHLKLGQYILEKGLPQTDPFSYTMPSYPFIDHEWLTGVIWAANFPVIGKSGLAFLTALMVVGAIAALFPFKSFSLGLTPFLLTVGVILPRYSLRSQVASWFLLTIFIRLLQTKLTIFRLTCLLLLQLFWTNLHGSFPLGVALITLYAIYEWVKTRSWSLAQIAAPLSLVMTLINPYGIRLWQEVFRHLKPGLLHSQISEWRPMYTYVDFSFWFLAVLFAMFVWRYRKRYTPWMIMVGSVLFAMSLTALRHAPLFALVSLPLIAAGMERLRNESDKGKGGETRYQLFSTGLILLSLGVVFIEGGFAVWGWSGYREGKYYPEKAIAFLSENVQRGELFVPYGWGGYLVWKLPDSKVFIDGRMPTFTWNAPEGESDNAFAEYVDVSQGKNVAEIFAKYRVKTVLLPAPREITQLQAKLYAYLRALSLVKSKDTPSDLFTTVLEKQGWQKVYQDQTAVIYTSPK